MNSNPAAGTEADQSNSPKAIILLVDDDALDRELMKGILIRETYTVIEAADGVEALEYFEKHEGSIDLLLTDVHMPNMDGVELAKKVLSRNPSVKVLFASGFKHTFASDIDGHPVDFFEKSAPLPTLTKKVQEMLFPTNPLKKLWQKVTASSERP